MHRFDLLLTELRQTVRRLIATPLFTGVALLTLALGIGANTAIFSILDGVLLRALPVVDEERLVVLTRPGDGEADVSVPDAADLRERARTLDSLALYSPYWALDLTGDGDPERLVTVPVDPQWFEMLGVRPVTGRMLADSDNVPGAEPVIVLGEAFWRERFGADPEIVGRVLVLSDIPYTVIGVAPADADVLELGASGWVALAAAMPWALEERGTNNLEALARLAPGIELAQARAELAALTQRLAEEHPDTNRGKLLTATPLRAFLVGDLRPVLVLLLAGVGLVLLIVCANIANLLLVRATARRHEIATRLAMGGSRRSVLRLLVVEAAVLSVVGAALGVGVAAAATRAALAIAPAGLPRAASVTIDGRVLLFTLAAALFATLAAGLLPGLDTLRRDLVDALGRGAGSSNAARRAGRLQGGLVVLEIALAFVLLTFGGLLLRSLVELRSVDLGFTTDRVLIANLVLPESRYSGKDAQTSAFREIVEALEARPEIASAAFVIGAPLSGFGAIGATLAFDDRPPAEPGDQPSARVRPVAGDYFATLGIAVERGRALGPQDRADGHHVAVVNEAFAAQFWPEIDDAPTHALGKRVAIVGWSNDGEPWWYEVVGVVSDVKTNALQAEDSVALYIPYEQRPNTWARFGTLAIRGSVSVDELARPLHEAVWSVDASVPLDSVAPLGELVDRATARERFVSSLLGVFSAFAVLIAIQGLYGVLAYVVVSQRRAIGVRMALGASRAVVLRAVLARGLRLASLGLAIGALGAVVAGRLLSGLLYGVSSTDPRTFVVCAAALALVSLLAAALPARRATRIDPASCLREEL
ncbi:MAG TPA: ABC transporter permease [Thermoanaerobaculia bacterium]|nr:ABC transporter permease [Thermoanaerobaculia bacterium]